MTYDNGPICPHCGGQTHYYDKAKRIVKQNLKNTRKSSIKGSFFYFYPRLGKALF